MSRIPCLLGLSVAIIAANHRIGHGAPAAPSSPGPMLSTPWPAQIDCPRFDRLEMSADDRIQTVEWRGSGETSHTFEIAREASTKDARDYLFKASSTFPCGDLASLCILYPRVYDRLLHTQIRFLGARSTQAVADGFPLGRLGGLILRPDPRRLADRRIEGETYKFGVRLILRCADRARASLYWACDARSCLLTTFRANPAIKERRRWQLDGPYLKDWEDGPRTPDLHRLLDTRPSALRRESKTIEEVTRDLLKEMEAVLAYACGGGACSPRIDDLRASTRLAIAAPLLPLGRVRPKHERDNAESLEESGWTARLGQGDVQADLACARHYHHEAADNPPHDYCQVSVFRKGVRLGDYFPYWFQQIELPDGGAVELRGNSVEFRRRIGGASGNDQIVLTGSAVATRP